MISYLYVNNYKSLVNFRIEWFGNDRTSSGVSVLIGSNGCGKSSVFEVIAAIRNFVAGSGRASAGELFPADTVTRWQDDSVQTFELGLELGETEFCYHLEVQHNENDLCRVGREYVKSGDHYLFDSNLGRANLYNDRMEKGAEVLVDWQYSGVAAVYARHDNKLLTALKEEIRSFVVCSPFPAMHAEISTEDHSLPAKDLSDITSYYRYLVQQYPEIIHPLWTDLKKCNPAFRRTYLDGMQENKVLKFEFDQQERQSYRFSELSSGEQILFDLYLLMNGVTAKGHTLLIDEPDNFLSLREIQPWCAALEETADVGGGQCLLISHHPEIIDYFGGTSGIWMERPHGMASRIVPTPKFSSGLRYSEAIARGDFDESAE